MSTERPHARYSPSTLAILDKCPLWKSDGLNSDYAQRGTDLGAALAEYAMTRQAPDMPELAYGIQAFDEIEQSIGAREWTAEEKLVTRIPDVWGYADLISAGEWDDEAYLIECKSGFGDRPDASESIQVAAYALGLLGRGYSRVVTFMVELDKRRWTRHDITSDDWELIESRIKEVIATAQNADHQKAATGSYCKYCGNKEGCPEVSLTPDTAAALLSTQNHQGLDPADFAKSLSPEGLGKTLRRVLPLFSLAEMYIGHLKSRTIAVMEAGGEVPGFRLKEKRGNRKWADEAAALVALQEAGYALEQIMTMKSPSAVEKLGKEAKKAIAEHVEYGPASKILEMEG